MCVIAAVAARAAHASARIARAAAAWPTAASRARVAARAAINKHMLFSYLDIRCKVFHLYGKNRVWGDGDDVVLIGSLRMRVWNREVGN